ncbi:hypothetical protein [Ulvibacterium sp.]|uniref:hypothetical protein n=1 Tax=Ulvibacterium sp. TaxID=2665914 RepID=UPI003CC69549
MKNVFPLIFLLGILQLQAQDPDPDPRLLDFTPPSPTAYSLTQFSAQQPALYTGTANTSIPLYTIDFDGWSLPITLNYHATGIRTNQEATEVGLGWSLSSTAVISRSIRKGNDFHNVPNLAKGYIHDTETVGDIINDLDNWTSLNLTERNSHVTNFTSSWYDTEPDTFDYNFFGFQGSFILSKKSAPTDAITVIKLKNDATIIQYFDGPNPYFTIKTPEGFEGTFDIKERTTNMAGYSPNPIGGPYDGTYIDIVNTTNRGQFRTVTAWYLSSIQSPRGKQISFNYNILSTQNSPFVSVGAPSFSDVHVTELQPGSQGISFSRLVTEHVYQQSIIIPNELSITFNQEDREDLRSNTFLFESSFPLTAQKPKRYTGLYIEGLDPVSTFEKNIVFGQSYFNLEYLLDESIDNINTEPAKYAWLRSRLDFVTVDDQTHRFFYNLGSNGIPSKFTRGIDHFGFYNGEEDNDQLLQVTPRILSDACSVFEADITKKFYYQTEGRKADFTYGIAGSLKRVQYPTGGYTDFVYEPHDYYVEGGSAAAAYYTPEALDASGASGNAIAGGLRIKELTTYEKPGMVSIKKTFGYRNLNESTGIMLTPFGHYSENLILLDTNGDGILNSNDICSYVWFSLGGISGQNTAEGKKIGYSQVTEIAEGKDGESYETEHYFTNIPTRRPVADNTVPYEPKTYKNGKLEDQILENISGLQVQSKHYGLYENFDSPILGLSYSNRKYWNNGYALSYYPYHLPVGFAEIDSINTKTTYGSRDVSNTVNYTFNAIGQQKEESTTNSKGEVLRTEYKRLEEFTGAACVYASDGVTCLGSVLDDENIVSPVLEKLTYVGDSVIAATGYRYDLEEGNVVLREVLEYDGSKANFTSSANGFEFPAYRSVVVYEDYDSEGNVLQYKVADGPTTSLVWGYNEEYPIVKGENIGHTDLAQAHTTALSNPTTYEENIRSNPVAQKALITTYTFDPMVGMVAMYDPSARKTTYSYDAFRRLETIKDLNNELLQDYEYHYKTPERYGGITSRTGINFGVVGPDSVRTINTGIKNEGNYDITINSLSLPTNFSSTWASTPFLIRPGDTFSLPVTYTSPNPGAGIEGGNMILQTTDNLDGNVSISLSANSAVETRILSLPQDCYEVGSGFAEIGILLNNDGNSPIKVTHVGIDTNELQLLGTYDVPPTTQSWMAVKVKLLKPLTGPNAWDGMSTIFIETDADTPVFNVQVDLTANSCN